MATLRFLQVTTDGDVLIDNNLAASGLGVLDSDKSHYMAITTASNLTENRTLSIETGDADRSLIIEGDSSIDQDLTTDASPVFAGLSIPALSLPDINVYFASGNSLQANKKQLWYDGNKGALRSGFDTGTHWDDVHVGEYSLASGYETTAQGPHSQAFGFRTTAMDVCTHAQGNSTIARGMFSHAEGQLSDAGGMCAHAEGRSTVTTGDFSHAEGNACRAEAESAHAEGDTTLSSGIASHSEGYKTTASGDYSHAAGNTTTASGETSTSKGEKTIASAKGSSAEGYESEATGLYSHAEGNSTEAIGYASHAEGTMTRAEGQYSHAEGQQTIASELCAHAEGMQTEASGSCSHAEGGISKAQGAYSHAEGVGTIASGEASHAQGSGATASGYGSHAEGLNTVANNYYSHAEGKNTSTNGRWGAHIMGEYGDATHDYSWHMANGNSSARGLAAKIICDGTTSGYGYANAWFTSGADYAEFFEWKDGNENDEDRIGHFVTLDGDKVRIATDSDDYILGIVSANSSIVGNDATLNWQGRYELDEFGRRQEIHVTEDAVTDGDGNIIVPERTRIRAKHNPHWTPDKEYIPRQERKEWDTVGMLGQILLRHDGTCEVNSYCKANKDGIATKSAEGYRVMKRISDTVVLILFR